MQPPSQASQSGGGLGVAERGLLIAEIVKTEKKYIQTLEGERMSDQ